MLRVSGARRVVSSPPSPTVPLSHCPTCSLLLPPLCSRPFAQAHPREHPSMLHMVAREGAVPMATVSHDPVAECTRLAPGRVCESHALREQYLPSNPSASLWAECVCPCLGFAVQVHEDWGHFTGPQPLLPRQHAHPALLRAVPLLQPLPNPRCGCPSPPPSSLPSLARLASRMPWTLDIRMLPRPC